MDMQSKTSNFLRWEASLRTGKISQFYQPLEKLLILRRWIEMQVLLPKEENNTSPGLRDEK